MATTVRLKRNEKIRKKIALDFALSFRFILSSLSIRSRHNHTSITAGDSRANEGTREGEM
jgi:hypothetical protein